MSAFEPCWADFSGELRKSTVSFRHAKAFESEVGVVPSSIPLP